MRIEPIGNGLILRNDSFVKTPLGVYEEWLDFSQLLQSSKQDNKSIKIEMKSGGVLIDKVL